MVPAQVSSHRAPGPHLKSSGRARLAFLLSPLQGLVTRDSSWTLSSGPLRPLSPSLRGLPQP